MFPEVSLFSADVQQLFVSKDEVQQWSPSLDPEDPELPHIKEEQQELWTSEGGEQLQGLCPVPMKIEDDEGSGRNNTFI